MTAPPNDMGGLACAAFRGFGLHHALPSKTSDNPLKFNHI